MNDIFRIEKTSTGFKLIGKGAMCDGSDACMCIGTLDQCKAKAALLGVVPHLLNDNGEYDVCMFKQPVQGDRVVRFRIDLQSYRADHPAITIKGDVDLKVIKVVTPYQLPSDKNPIPDGTIHFSEYNKVWMRKVGKVYLTSSSANKFAGECWCHSSDLSMLEHNMKLFISNWFKRENEFANAVISNANKGLSEMDIFFGRS